MGRQIGDIRWKQGVNNLVDSVTVRHVSGGSTLELIVRTGQGVFRGDGAARNMAR